MACPDPTVLERYRRGELSASQTRIVAAHVDTCATCRMKLRTPKPKHESGYELNVEQPLDAAPTDPLRVPDLPPLDAAPTDFERLPPLSLDEPTDPLRVPKLPTPPAPTVSSPPPFLERGTPVGRYVILEQLGSGGMGVVYAALDPELDRRVALKLLRSEGEESGRPSEAKLRLLREAQAMARLSHPNIVTIYDVGSHGSQVYIAMELVQGVTLTEWLRVRRPWRDVVKVFCQAGRGLEAAHQAGLVHRDFKPDNVLVGDDGSARVMDFGLARTTHNQRERPWRPTDPTAGGEFLYSALTRKGTVVGTPSYMSPEQFVDDPLDARSDQFSFCVALYEALYGDLPFHGETVKELAFRVMGGQVRRFPPGARAPLGVHRALVKGLRPSPAERHPTMAALVSALERAALVPRRALAAGLLLLLSATGVVWTLKTAPLRQHECMAADRQLSNIWDRGRKKAIHDAFSATGLPYAEDTWRGVERALDAYAAGWVAAHDTACEETWVRHDQPEEIFTRRVACLDERKRELETISNLFANADEQVVEKALSAASGLTAVRPCATIDGTTPAPPAPPPQNRDRVRALRGQLSEAIALQGGGVFPKAMDLSKEVAAAARQLQDRPLEAEALLLLGRLSLESGDPANAEQDLLGAYLAAERGKQRELAVRALTELVPAVGQRMGREKEGRRWSRMAEAILEGMGNPPDLRAQLLANTALVLAADGDRAEAAEKLKDALALREQMLGPDDVAVALTRQELGTVYRSLGKYQDALDHQQRAVPVIEKTYGREHPRLARALNHLGMAYKSLGRYSEARDAFERALKIDERAFGKESPQVAGSVNNRASVLEEQNDLDGALAGYRRALELEERAAQPNQRRVAAELNSMGDVYLKLGQPNEALKVFEKALTKRQEALGQEHFDVAKDLLGMGETYLALKRTPEALGALEQALKIREAHSGFPTTLARIRFSLARALWEASGDRARAKKLATQAREAYAAAGQGSAAELAAVDAWLAHAGR